MVCPGTVKRLIERAVGPRLVVGAVLLFAPAACLFEPPAELAVWSEFAPPDAVARELGVLAEFDCAAYVAVRPGEVTHEWWALLLAARDAGVQIRPWLLLPVERGLWLNESNIDEFAAFAGSLLDEAAARGILVEWLILDVEPELALAETLADAVRGGGVGAALRLLREQHDPGAFAEARGRLAALVDSVQARGVKVMCAQLPWLLDDLADGDDDIQDVFNTPLTGIDWDQVAVMLYRPVFRDLTGLPLTTAFVRSYASEVMKRFGSASQVAVGTIGAPGVLTAPGYVVPDDFAPDIATARAAGVRSISVYSLDGALQEGGLRVWLEAASDQSRFVPGFDRAAVRVFSGVTRAADWALGRL